MNRRSPLSIAVLSSLAFLACASEGGLPKGGRLEEPPKGPSVFGPLAQVEVIVVRARFVEDHEKLFGEDLISDQGVIPIELKLGVKGVGSEHETINVNPDKMEFRLYLEDGTALERVTADQVADGDDKLAAKLKAQSLTEDFLPNFDAAPAKFVFFKLSPSKDFDASDSTLIHRAGDVERVLAIDRSLLSFRINRSSRPLNFSTGIGSVQRASN